MTQPFTLNLDRIIFFAITILYKNLNILVVMSPLFNEALYERRVALTNIQLIFNIIYYKLQCISVKQLCKNSSDVQVFKFSSNSMTTPLYLSSGMNNRYIITDIRAQNASTCYCYKRISLE